MKKEYLIIIFLLLGPFLDVASFYGTSLSVLVRGIYLAVLISYLLFKKKDLKFLLPLLVFSFICFLYQTFYLKHGISSNISMILKFLYLPISIIYFKNYLFPINKEKIFSIILFTYVGVYLFSYVTGIGADAYLESDGKSGFKGLFSSINEFSAILVGLLPVVSLYLKNNKRYLLMILLIIFSLVCALLIGTKVLLGGIIFTIMYLLWLVRKKIFFDRNKIQKTVIVSGIVIVLVSSVFLFTKTRTYQNMVIQNNFFKVESVFSFEFVNKVIYNDRLTFLSDNYDYFLKQDLASKLFGIGIEDYDIKMVEIDIFDILFRYGTIGFLMFIGSIVYLIRFKELKQVEKISFVLFIIISLTSGHVLIYPAVCIYIGVLFSKNIENNKISKKSK